LQLSQFHKQLISTVQNQASYTLPPFILGLLGSATLIEQVQCYDPSLHLFLARSIPRMATIMLTKPY